jgi:hypothetical protein
MRFVATDASESMQAFVTSQLRNVREISSSQPKLIFSYTNVLIEKRKSL